MILRKSSRPGSDTDNIGTEASNWRPIQLRFDSMFFRRKKQPDTDQTVLTETLRSLEDLIAETSKPAAADTGQETAAAGLPLCLPVSAR